MALKFMLMVLAIMLVSYVSATSTRGEERDWRTRLQACDEFMQRRQQQQPSQRCCQSVQRISADERCRALKEVYGGGGRSEYVEEEVMWNREQQQTTQRASRLLQQCNLRPSQCGSPRSSESWFWW